MTGVSFFVARPKFCNTGGVCYNWGRLRNYFAGNIQDLALQLEAHYHHPQVGIVRLFLFRFQGVFMQAQQQFTIVLPFRVTPSQREQLRELAAQRGVSVSALIRSSVLPNGNTINTQRDGAALPAK